jgi:hypothetical protein
MTTGEGGEAWPGKRQVGSSRDRPTNSGFCGSSAGLLAIHSSGLHTIRNKPAADVLDLPAALMMTNE